MDQSISVQNRRQRRSNVLLAGIVETAGRSLEVRVRNLSAEGVLIEAAVLPRENDGITFRKGDLEITGKVIWVHQHRAGIRFDAPLTPETLLRHVPVPRPRPIPSFRRPGIGPQPLTDGERLLERTWGVKKVPGPSRD